MRKYLAATALGAMLMAGQAAAYDSDIVSVGDRVASQSASSDSMEGMDAYKVAALIGAAAVMGIFFWALSQGNGSPSTP